METDYGHVLVFGVNDDLRNAFDFARVDNPLPEVLEAAERCGAFAAPCHPGRKNVGLFAHYEAKGAVDGVHTVEVLNGGSIPGEDELSLERAAAHGYRGFGGSDSHIVSRIGFCATEFDDEVKDIDGLVAALGSGRFAPVSFRDQEDGAP